MSAARRDLANDYAAQAARCLDAAQQFKTLKAETVAQLGVGNALLALYHVVLSLTSERAA